MIVMLAFARATKNLNDLPVYEQMQLHYTITLKFRG